MARKTIQQAAANLQQVAGLIGERYTQGINGADWQTPAASQQAETNWGQGVQAAIASGARREGILGVTNQQWRTAAIEKGAAVIGRRITESISKYSQNFGPILIAMNEEANRLPDRTSSATTNVQQRLIPIIHAAQRAAGKPEN